MYGFLTFAVLTITHPLMSCWLTGQLEYKVSLIATQTYIRRNVFKIFPLKFGDMCEAFYDLNWENATATIRYNLSFAMYRFQKPIYITIGNFVKLNLRFFILVTCTLFEFESIFF